MKKLLCLACILSFVFVTFVFAGCGGDTGETSISASEIASNPSSEIKASRIQSNNSVSNPLIVPSVSINTQSNQSAITNGSAVYVTSVSADGTTDLGKAIVSINMIGSISSANFTTKKQLIENAELKCNAIADKTLIPNYQSLLDARALFNSLELDYTVSAFMVKYNALPEVSSLTKDNVVAVCQLRETYNSFSSEGLTKLGDYQSIKTKLDASFNALKSAGLLQFELVVDNISDLSQSQFYVFTNCTLGSNSNDKVSYGGKSLTKCVDFGAEKTISFNTTITGVLKLYCYGTANIQLKDANQLETTASAPEDLGDDFVIKNYSITKAGEYSLSMIEEEVQIFAIVISAQ